MITEIFLYNEPTDGIHIINSGANLIVFFNLVNSGNANMYSGESVYTLGRSYKSIVSAIITDKYDSDDTQAILANYTDSLHDATISEAKKAEYQAEYNAYQSYREFAKEIANKVIQMLNGIS